MPTSPPTIPPAPRPRRRTRILVAATALGSTLAVAGLAPIAHATTATSGPASTPGAATSSITYTAKTVVISTTTLKAQLLSVSHNGATYTFRKRAGALSRVVKGTVMLLPKLAVRDVTRTAFSSGHFVVTTKPAAITDLVRNGDLSSTANIDFSHAFLVSGNAVPAGRVRAGGSDLGLAQRFGLQPLTSTGLKVSGTIDGYDWEAAFKPSTTGVGVSITIGRGRPIKLDVTIAGTLNNLRTATNIAVNKGKLSKAKLLANNVSGDFTLSYSAQPTTGLGLGKDGGILITLPAEIMVPFFVGEIPFFVGVKVAIFASAGFNGANDPKIEGSWKLSYDGAGGFSTSSSGATTPAGVIKALGDIALSAKNAVAYGPVSFIFGARMPQLQLGLGVKGFNVAGNINLFGSTQITTYGAGCDTRKMEIGGSAGANASFFGLSANLGSATLFDKTYTASYPRGCG